MQYRREWEQFRKSVDWLDGQPTALVQNLSEVRKHLPSTERAVEHVKRRAYNNLWVGNCLHASELYWLLE